MRRFHAISMGLKFLLCFISRILLDIDGLPDALNRFSLDGFSCCLENSCAQHL
jgi:hypothetical protein